MSNDIPYWQQRRDMKLKGKTSTTDKTQKPDNEQGDQGSGTKKVKLPQNSPPQKKVVQARVKKKKSKGWSKAKRTEKAAAKVFYANQLMNPPDLCEECDAPLIQEVGINPRAIICHIVPKNKTSGCPSVATHPLNRWFGCQRCHDRYDKASEEEITRMRIFKAICQRVAKFFNEIKPAEQRRVPECLRPIE